MSAEIPSQSRSNQAPSVDALMPLVYQQLKILAHAKLRSERAGHTLSATALVHEAWLKLREQPALHEQHFLALAASAMRQILVNHALAKRADKRSPDAGATLLASESFESANAPYDVLKLDQALQLLQQKDPRAAKLAELRAFAGLSLIDAAAALTISEASAKRDWVYAKLFLAQALSEK